MSNSIRRALSALVAAGSLLFAAGTFAAKNDKSEPDDLDRMNLAKVMLSDGHNDRALAVLGEVNPEAEGVDPMEYFRLLGLANFLLGQHTAAEQALGRAIQLGDTNTNTFLQRASSLIQLERPREAIEVLRSSPPEALRKPARYIFESNAHYALGDEHAAFEALDRGHVALPEDDRIARKPVLLLVDMGLYQAAVEEAQTFFSRASATPEDYIALSTALVEANQKDRAALLLEQAALLYPEDVEIRTRLALAYYSKSAPLAAGDILYPVALIDASKAQSAAELYIKAGRFSRAERLNAKVEDQAEKVKQRMIILLEQGHFEAVATMDQRAERLGLLEDEDIAYALAYAHYRTGNFERMEQLVSLISDPTLFRKAVELRRSADLCRQSIWKCD